MKDSTCIIIPPAVAEYLEAIQTDEVLAGVTDIVRAQVRKDLRRNPEFQRQLSERAKALLVEAIYVEDIS